MNNLNGGKKHRHYQRNKHKIKRKWMRYGRDWGVGSGKGNGGGGIKKYRGVQVGEHDA